MDFFRALRMRASYCLKNRYSFLKTFRADAIVSGPVANAQWRQSVAGGVVRGKRDGGDRYLCCPCVSGSNVYSTLL